MPSRRKSGGGVMDGLCPAASRSDPRVMGLLAVEAPRLSGKRCPSRGDVGTRALVESWGRWDHPALRSKNRRRNRGARVARTRRGTFALVVLRQQAAGGEVLRSGLLGPCNPALSFNGHRRKRWSDRGVARKRRYDRTVAFRVAFRCELAAQRDRSWRGCHGSQPSRSFFDRGRPRRRKKARWKRGRVRGHRRGGTPGFSRETGARECVRASEV